MSSLILFICLVPLLTIALLGLNLLLASNKPDPEKVSAYECGFEPFADARSPFSINFYLVAILYLVFDLEILLLYPLIMSLHTVSLFGFWVAILFCIILALGFVYEFSKGALEYATHQTSSESTDSHQNSPPSTRSIFFTPPLGPLPPRGPPKGPEAAFSSRLPLPG
jgi:NADH:ubiquinone oxidoreductase subunit 3 (subunit A)